MSARAKRRRRGRRTKKKKKKKKSSDKGENALPCYCSPRDRRFELGSGYQGQRFRWSRACYAQTRRRGRAAATRRLWWQRRGGCLACSSCQRELASSRVPSPADEQAHKRTKDDKNDNDLALQERVPKEKEHAARDDPRQDNRVAVAPPSDHVHELADAFGVWGWDMSLDWGAGGGEEEEERAKQKQKQQKKERHMPPNAPGNLEPMSLSLPAAPPSVRRWSCKFCREAAASSTSWSIAARELAMALRSRRSCCVLPGSQ